MVRIPIVASHVELLNVRKVVEHQRARPVLVPLARTILGLDTVEAKRPGRRIRLGKLARTHAATMVWRSGWRRKHRPKTESEPPRPSLPTHRQARRSSSAREHPKLRPVPHIEVRVCHQPGSSPAPVICAGYDHYFAASCRIKSVAQHNPTVAPFMTGSSTRHNMSAIGSQMAPSIQNGSS